MDRVVRYILSHFPHQPTDGQREACHKMAAFLYDPDPTAAFVLNGYAGTGKTSLVSALIQSAPALHIKTLLLAPTGRAAKVLSAYSGQPAFTIHKRIYQTVTDGRGMVHICRAKNKHRYTLFIVDEASMIGLHSEGAASGHSLLDDLIDFVMDGDHCRLMFIGDTAQLPPVGADDSPALNLEFLRQATPLHPYPATLTEVVRQQKNSGILYNATLLRMQISQMEECDVPQLPLFDLSDCTDIQRLHGADLEEVLNQEYSAQGQEQMAIVTRSNKSANMFNQAIRNRILFREEEVNAGDYLMVVKNNYYWLDKDSGIGFIANGDIVEVLSVRNVEELYGFRFADATLRFVDYPEAPTIDSKLLLQTLHSESPALTRDESQRLFEQVMEDYADMPHKSDRLRALKENPYYNALQVKFAYALTCHKTQGGQWGTVIVDQGYMTDDMVNREYLRWLYTAITRATGKVFLLNFNDNFFADGNTFLSKQ